MRMFDRFWCRAVLAVLLGLQVLPLASWAQSEPTAINSRRWSEDSSNREFVVNFYGGAFFRGTPTVGSAYGAVLLPYDLPAGTYINAANYPLQLSVQATARVGGGTADNPCYLAQVKIGSSIVGQAAGVPCSAVVSTFMVTLPAGAAFELNGGTAKVTATHNIASWRDTGIVFDVRRERNDACEHTVGVGTISTGIWNNLDEVRQEEERCPATRLDPKMPPGIDYRSLSAYRLLLSVAPFLSNNDPNWCWRITVRNETSGALIWDYGAPSGPPGTPCEPIPNWVGYDMVIPINTRFSLAGANAVVTILGTNTGSWRDTGIVFPVTFVGFEYGECANFNGGRMRTRFANYINNRNEPMRLVDMEAC